MPSVTPPDPDPDGTGTRPGSAAEPSVSPVTPERPETSQPASLTHRWWWQGAVLVVAGIAVVAFQWEVIPSGEANVANWLVGLLGAGAIGYGAVELVAAQRRRRADDAPPADEPPGQDPSA